MINYNVCFYDIDDKEIVVDNNVLAPTLHQAVEAGQQQYENMPNCSYFNVYKNEDRLDAFNNVVAIEKTFMYLFKINN
jgi:hypothetical protein